MQLYIAYGPGKVEEVCLLFRMNKGITLKVDILSSIILPQSYKVNCFHFIDLKPLPVTNVTKVAKQVKTEFLFLFFKHIFNQHNMN